jgi:hypothetical protein
VLCEPHNFHAAPGKNFDAASAPYNTGSQQIF